MRRHVGPFVLLSASLGLTCQSAKHVSKIDPPHSTAPTTSTLPTPATSSQFTPPAPPPRSAAFVALSKMTQLRACGYPTNIPPSQARKGTKPFTALEAHCNPKSEDFFCDQVDTAPKGADACFVSNDHLRTAQKRAAIATTSPGKPIDPWDGKKKPKYFDRIDAHLHLDENEEAMLRKNGFVVLDRLAYSNYAHAFHDVFQEELPLYVGVDPILHAIFRATDGALEVTEQKRLVPALDKMLDKLHKKLADSTTKYDDVTRKDLDLYIGMAKRLGKQFTAPEKPASVFGQDSAIEALHDVLYKSEGLVPIEIFGRSRMIDVSQYSPRGHYTHMNPQFSFEAYFRVLTWLTRFEWNLVSRGSRSSHPDATPDPRQTPRESRDALALADLFRNSGALTELGTFEEVYSAFGGSREDVGIPQLLEIMDQQQIKPHDTDAPEKLERAIGTRFKRTARTHFMPQGVTDLPVISTVIGPRISPDIAPLEHLVHDHLPNRFELGAADIGFLLGHARAKTYLRDDLQKFPELENALKSARHDLQQRTSYSPNIQNSYLQALLSLSTNPTGLVPSFMQRDAYADLRLSSALVGYGQLRHTFVLLDGQGYDAYGCAIPESYVEPLAPFYTALTEYVQRLRYVSGGFDGLSRVLNTLSAITKTELARGAPTKDQMQWLGMVAEFIPQGGYADSGEPPKWTGWYFDMFEDREQGASKAADFIADYFTLTNLGKVAYLGTDGPRLGVFVVDTGGEPRAFVGPVAHGYELKASLGNRLDDAAARTAEGKSASFRESFAAKPWTEPTLGLGVQIYQCAVEGKLEVRVLVAADKPAGPVSITLLDHHADPLAPTITYDVEDDIVVFPFRFPEVVKDDKPAPSGSDDVFLARQATKYLVEAISVRIEDLSRSGLGNGPYDYFTSPSVFFGKGNEENMPLRNLGATQGFVIGGSWVAPMKDYVTAPKN